HHFQQGFFFVQIKQIGFSWRAAEESNAGSQAVSAPVAHAADDEMIRGYPTSDQTAVGNVAVDDRPRNFAHADLIPSVSNADGDDPLFFSVGGFKEPMGRAHAGGDVPATHG